MIEMIKSDYSPQPQVSDEVTSDIPDRGARDLVVLKYMAQKIHTVLHTLEQPVAGSSPLCYSLEVRHQCQQRIIMYDPQFLLQNVTLSFVGFVSGKQKTVDPFVENEMKRVDGLLIEDLINAPGLLCYSSLELRTGKWYNLVLLANFNLKAHLKNSPIHCYGAYQLAVRYYESIRLHSGIIVGGLGKNMLQLQKTKCYTCQTPEPHFTVRELTYA
jgi:hypothetical protein